jgi:hypothetical protein
MKKLFLGSVILAVFSLTNIIFQMTSCRKADAQNSNTVNYPIQGLWIGTYTLDGQSKLGEQYFSFVIKPDGSMIADTKGSSIQHLATGTWTLNGTTLTCNFTYVYGQSSNIGVTQITSAEWDKAGKLTGTWKNVAPHTGSGVITMTRIN